MSHPTRRAAVLAACALALLLPASAHAASQQLYVSLGDSYATGYQADVKKNTKNGFAYQIPGIAKKRGYDLKLVNFGCGGATTVSLLGTKGCNPRALGPGGETYPSQTQLAAAEAFIKKNKAKVGLITVSISGNDVTKCAGAPEPIPCVAGAVENIKKNVTKIAKRLRKVAGPKVKIVGTTYPDVILGGWVGTNPNQDLAGLSVVAFKQLINPALKAAYASAKGDFVDVTAATGAYTPLDQTVADPTYGTIPVAVQKVCQLSFYCDFRDIHARTEGYRIIADLVAKRLPKRG
jgi:lysophospholipase L1-like esterase